MTKIQRNVLQSAMKHLTALFHRDIDQNVIKVLEQDRIKFVKVTCSIGYNLEDNKCIKVFHLFIRFNPYFENIESIVAIYI